MANAETVKQGRMHIRLDALSKQKLERAAAFYRQFGFIPLPSKPLKLFLPMESVTALVH